MRPGNVHALGSRACLEDETFVTDEKVGLESLTVALADRVHEGDQLVCSLRVVSVVPLECYDPHDPIVEAVVVDRQNLANDDDEDVCSRT